MGGGDFRNLARMKQSTKAILAGALGALISIPINGVFLNWNPIVLSCGIGFVVAMLFCVWITMLYDE